MTTVYNPQTGANVDVKNITPTSISTPAYSYFLGQPQGRAVLGLSTPTPQQTVQPIEVKPNVQAPVRTPTYTQQQVEAYAGPGMVAASRELSPSTIQFLSTQGLAPSDVSQKALGEYIAIGKSYQSKQASFQPVESPLEYFVGSSKVGTVSKGVFTFSGGGQKVLEENFPFSSRVFEQLPPKEQAIKSKIEFFGKATNA